mgnify:CR=1 FL=1
MTDTDRLITADNLSFSRQGRRIIDRVSLTLDRREVLTIIGPNGAGKTSLIKLILGLEAPDAGQVGRLPGLVIGYVPQKIELQTTLPLPVRRFLALTGRSVSEQREALAQTGIEERYDSQVSRLSGGEMQRLLLARALLRKPDLLVLDEPAQGVDINGQASLYALIRRLRDRLNCGVIMISHDLHLVMASTDRVICLNHHVCCSGHPEKISSDPAFVETFGPEVARSLAVYSHHHNHEHAIDGHVAHACDGDHVHG